VQIYIARLQKFSGALTAENKNVFSFAAKEGCVRSSMLHKSETWPVRKENVVALQRAEVRMVRRMCGNQSISQSRL